MGLVGLDPLTNLGEGNSVDKPTGRRGPSALVGNSPRWGKLLLQAYVQRTLLALPQLARSLAAGSLAFSCKGAQFGFSGCGDPAFRSWFSTTRLKTVVEVTTSGLPQVCKTVVWGRQGHAPSRTSSSKNHKNHGSQLLWAPTSPMVLVGDT